MSRRFVKGDPPLVPFIAQNINDETVQREALKYMSDGELAIAVVWEVVRNLLVKKLVHHAQKILQGSSSSSALPPLVLFTPRQPSARSAANARTILGPSERALQCLLAGTFYEDPATGAYYVAGPPDLFRVSLFERSDGTVRDVERAIVGPDAHEYILHGHGFAERLFAGMYSRQGIGGADIPRSPDGGVVSALSACEDGLDVKAHIQGGRQVLVDSNGKVEAREDKPPRFLKEAVPDATGAVHMSVRSLDTISEAVEQHLGIGPSSQAARHGTVTRTGLRAVPLNKDLVCQVDELDRASAIEHPEYGKGTKRATDAALLANGVWREDSSYQWLVRPALEPTPTPLFVRRNQLKEKEAQAAEELKRAAAEAHAGQAAAAASSSGGGAGGGAGYPTGGTLAPAGTGKGAGQVRLAPRTRINATEYGRDKEKEQAKLKERVKGTCRLCGEEEGTNLDNVWTHLCSEKHKLASAANAARLEPVSQAVNGSSVQQPTADEYALPLRVAAQAAVLNTEVGRQQHMLNGVFASLSIAANVEFVKQKKEDSKQQSSSGKEETYTGKFRGPRGLGFVRPTLPRYARVLLLDGQTGEVLAATANITFKDMMLVGAFDLCVDYQSRQEQHSSGGGVEPTGSLPVVDASRCVLPCTDVRLLRDVHHPAFPSLRTLEILPQGPFTSESLATAGPGAMLLDDSPGMAHQVYKGLSTALLRQTWAQTCRVESVSAGTGGMEQVITPALWDNAGSASASSVPSQPATRHDIALARAIVTLDTSSSVMSALLEAAGITTCPELTKELRAVLQALGVADVQAAIDAEARVPRARPYPLVVGKSLHNGRALSALRHAAEQVTQSLANTANTESGQGADMVPRQTSGLLAKSTSTAANGSPAAPSLLLPSEPDLKAKLDAHAFQRTALALAPPHVRLGGPCLLLWLGLMEDDEARTKGNVPLPPAHTRGLPRLTPVLQDMYQQKVQAIAANEAMSGCDTVQLESMNMRTKEWHKRKLQATSDSGRSQPPSAFAENVENATGLASSSSCSHVVTEATQMLAAEPQGFDSCQAGAPLGEGAGLPLSTPAKQRTAAEDGVAGGPLSDLLGASEDAVLEGNIVQPAVSMAKPLVLRTSASSAAACSRSAGLVAVPVAAIPDALAGTPAQQVSEALVLEAAASTAHGDMAANLWPATTFAPGPDGTELQGTPPSAHDQAATEHEDATLHMETDRDMRVIKQVPVSVAETPCEGASALVLPSAAAAVPGDTCASTSFVDVVGDAPTEEHMSGHAGTNSDAAADTAKTQKDVQKGSARGKGGAKGRPIVGQVCKDVVAGELPQAEAGEEIKEQEHPGAEGQLLVSDSGNVQSAAVHVPLSFGRARGKESAQPASASAVKTSGKHKKAEADDVWKSITGSGTEVAVPIGAEAGACSPNACAEPPSEPPLSDARPGRGRGRGGGRGSGRGGRGKHFSRANGAATAAQAAGCSPQGASGAVEKQPYSDDGAEVAASSTLASPAAVASPAHAVPTGADAGACSLRDSAAPQGSDAACAEPPSEPPPNEARPRRGRGRGGGRGSGRGGRGKHFSRANGAATAAQAADGSPQEASSAVEKQPYADDGAEVVASTLASPAAVASPAHAMKRKRSLSHQTVLHGDARAPSEPSKQSEYSQQVSSAVGMSQQAEKASKRRRTVATLLQSSHHEPTQEARDEDSISLGREQLRSPPKELKSEFDYDSPSSHRKAGERRSSLVGQAAVGGQAPRPSAAGTGQKAAAITKATGKGLGVAIVSRSPAIDKKRKAPPQQDDFAFDDDGGVLEQPPPVLTAGKGARSATAGAASSVEPKGQCESVLARFAPTPVALSSKLPCSTPAAARQPGVGGAPRDRKRLRLQRTATPGESVDPSAVSAPRGAPSDSTTGGQIQGKARVAWSSPRRAAARAPQGAGSTAHAPRARKGAR